MSVSEQHQCPCVGSGLVKPGRRVTREAASEPSLSVPGTSQPLASPAGLRISFQPLTRPRGKGINCLQEEQEATPAL